MSDNKQVPLDEAAEDYSQGWGTGDDAISFKNGVLSATAKQYWFNQWQSQQISKPQVVFEGEMQFLKMVISDNTSTDDEAIKIIDAINHYLKCVQDHQQKETKPSNELIRKEIFKHLNSLPYKGGYPVDWQETLAEHLSKFFSQQKETKPIGLRWVKASERKSDHYEKVCCQIDNQYWLTGFYDNSRGCYLDQSGRVYQLNQIEWLEGELWHTVIVVKDYSAIKELLEGMFKYEKSHDKYNITAQMDYVSETRKQTYQHLLKEITKLEGETPLPKPVEGYTKNDMKIAVQVAWTHQEIRLTADKALCSNVDVFFNEFIKEYKKKPVDSINFLKWVKDHVTFNDETCKWTDREGDTYTEEKLYDLYTNSPFKNQTKPVEDGKNDEALGEDEPTYRKGDILVNINKFNGSIDVIGNCANCGVEYHIHKLS